MVAGRRRRGVRVRRSRHIVAYWRNRTLVACNYATGTRAEVPQKACELLNFCDDWTKLDDVENAGFVPPATFRATIDKMVSLTLLERSDRLPDPRVSAMDTLRQWNPQAGFFHATTKDVRYASPRVAARYARAASRQSRAPAAIKRYPNAQTIDLRRPDSKDALPIGGRAVRDRAKERIR